MATGALTRPTIRLERSLLKQGHDLIAGVDEVGRGSWAGPVVAAAVILPLRRTAVIRTLRDVRDSKVLAPHVRRELSTTILEICLAVGIGWASAEYVDSDGLAAANRRALQRAIDGLSLKPDALVVDHFRLPECPLPQLCISKGDSHSLSIASASIVAKVFRDSWMERCDPRFPVYGFARHKGYGTVFHQRALEDHGPSSIHRLSFAPVGLCSR